MDYDISLSPYEWPEFVFYRSFSEAMHPQPIGTMPQGARWGMWPFYFEEYRSDNEPVLVADDTAPNRIIMWHRATRQDVPTGWITLPVSSGIYIGYAKLQDGDHTVLWKERAARYAKHLRREKGHSYEIVELPYETFAAAYAKSTVAREVPTFELKRLLARLSAPRARVSLWGAQRLSDGKIMAGLSAFETNVSKAAHYSAGFYLPEAEREHFMIALIDHWFGYCASQGIDTIHLGTFVPPKERGTARGRTISSFKSQFVTDYLRFQPPLIRFKRGRIFR